MSLFYLFTRFKFNWSEIEFSFFSTYNMAVHLLGKYNPEIENSFKLILKNSDDNDKIMI